jgi:MoaA/NifB/PqqE/SkfB family radical SAM enzyme
MYQHAELVHWMNNQNHMKLLPAQVDIDLTNVCNQDCYYCNSAEFRAAMPVQKKYTEYIKLLDTLASWRSHSPNSYGTTHTITYPGGGEPTVLIGYEHVIEHTIDLGFCDQHYHQWQ